MAMETDWLPMETGRSGHLPPHPSSLAVRPPLLLRLPPLPGGDQDRVVPQPAAISSGVVLESPELVAAVELGAALGHSREARYERSPEVGRPQDGQMSNRLARWFLELAHNASAALAESCFRPSRVSPPPCVASAFGKLPRLLDTQPLDLIDGFPPKRRHHRRHDNRRDYPTHTSPQHEARETRPA